MKDRTVNRYGGQEGSTCGRGESEGEGVGIRLRGFLKLFRGAEGERWWEGGLINEQCKAIRIVTMSTHCTMNIY
jgi:hypothetical protein